MLPLFPLSNVVLFPGAYLPLHIFEPRYRAMVRDVLAGDRIARAARDVEQRGAVRRQLDMIAAAARDAVPEPNDRDDVIGRVQPAGNRTHV